ncbi:MAG: IPT/TIG domain-containing protein [Acidobacteriia bacterium]|nr:IPT/TIG domain-containing protein [Terriglobia bacterium]
MYSRRWLIAVLAVWGLAAGCSQFNTNLTPQTSSATLRFVSPGSATVGGPAFTLTANGSGFVTGAIILWNGTQLPTVLVSSIQLTATVPASSIATAGSAQVAVQIPGSAVSATSNVYATNTTEVSNVVLFSINPPAPSPPTITQLSPSNIGAGSVAFTLTVTGTNFITGANGSVIYWNGVPVTPTTVTNTTTASAQIPASDVASVGIALVSVSNAASGGTSSSAITFTITSNSPTLTPNARSASTASGPQQSSPGVTADRRFLVFAMASTDGITERPETIQNVFVRDTCAGAPASCMPSTSLESVGTDGHPGDDDSTSPSISADGRYVAFVSSATNLVDGDMNGVSDVFVRDTCVGAPSGCTPSTQRVSVASDGTQANDASQSASISATGRYITFRSLATNLDPASSSTNSSNIFLRDTCAGASSGCTPSTQLLNLQN